MSERFRKKPVVIEAVQFDGAPAKDPPGVFRREVDGAPYVVTIHDQRSYLSPGDWVIAEPDGVHFYPCKPDIFAATYEPALAASSAASEDVETVASFIVGWWPGLEDGISWGSDDNESNPVYLAAKRLLGAGGAAPPDGAGADEDALTVAGIGYEYLGEYMERSVGACTDPIVVSRSVLENALRAASRSSASTAGQEARR